MKLTQLLVATSCAVLAASSWPAVAAQDKPADTMDGQVASQKKLHSHVEEKTGVPQKIYPVAQDKPNPWKDRTRHFHPRDGK